MRKIITIILLSCISIFAQNYPEYIRAISPDTTFTIVINQNVMKIISKVDSMVDDVYGIYNLKVYSMPSNKFIQEIKDTMSFNIEDANIKLFDVNDDNYSDIALIKDFSREGYAKFDFWLYDDKSKSFKYNSAYSDLCCNMEIDTTNKEINISYYNELNGFSEDISYVITESKPILINYRTTQDFKSHGIDSVLIKEFNVINGKSKLLKEYKVKKEDGWQ